MLLLTAVFLTASLTQACLVSIDDCIAEKYYRFSKAHTACIAKSSAASSSGVSSSEQIAIVTKHNDLRALQSAKNMRKMVWDEEIAAIAQRWADNCEFAHDDERRIPGRFPLGQNLAYGYADWDKTIQAWYDEIDDFTYNDKLANVFSSVGHYTQLVWARTSRIGCGYAICSSLSNSGLYVCNYGPAGNIDWWKPYDYGPKCSACPGRCSAGLCDCNGKVCENGGTLDLSSCLCSCKKDWLMADKCSLDCDKVTEPSSCASGGFFHGKCKKWSNVPNRCPATCKVCPYSGIAYTNGEPAKDTVPNVWMVAAVAMSLLYHA